MAANPAIPIVVQHNRSDGNPCQDPYIILAELQLDTGNVSIIRLFTIVANVRGSGAFDPATHVKDSTQYEGV